jgi:hypothetical protein
MPIPVDDNHDYGSTAKPINVPSPTNAGDGVNKSYVDSTVGGTGAIVFAAYTESDAETSQSTVSFVDKINASFTVAVTGTHIVECTFFCRSATANQGVTTELLVGGVSIGIVQQIQIRVAAPSDIPAYTIMKRLSLTAGSNVIQLRYKSTNAGTSAFIKNARILITKG